MATVAAMEKTVLESGIRVAVHHYPCIGQSICKEPLALLHGWASDTRVWQPLLRRLENRFHLIGLDLPGFGDSPPAECYDKKYLLDLMAEALPERSFLLGWSLGGMLAVEFAASYPERIGGLVAIGANASFIQRSGWPAAMDEATFDSFCRSFDDDPALCLKRFNSLQTKGESDERKILKELRPYLPFPPEDGRLRSWQQALALLGDLDQRRVIADLPVPGLFVFAKNDNLVPSAAAEDSLYRSDKRRAVVLDDCGHIAPFSSSEKIARLVEQFIVDRKRRLDKQRIARSFSRAAASYDRVAHLQRETGRELFARIPDGIEPLRILDLGCGTGHFSRLLQERFPDAEVIGLDLAEGMVRFASEGCGPEASCIWLCGDAETLPLADSSFELVFSNLVLQWCEDLPSLSSELLRILMPGGLLLYTSLGPGTLRELRAAWSAVDEEIHVNSFPSPELLVRNLKDSGCRQISMERRREVLYYPQLRNLMAELKALGAHNINYGRRTSITGRTRLAGLVRAYEQFRDGLLPASWDMVYVSLER